MMPNLRVFMTTVLCSSLLWAMPGQADESLNFEPIPQQTLLDYLGGKTNFTLLDARTAEEYAAGHIWGAQNVPADADLSAVDALPADAASPIVVYCKSGIRAEALQAALLASGYTNVRVLGPAQMLWAGELPVFNCGATEVSEPALVTANSSNAPRGEQP